MKVEDNQYLGPIKYRGRFFLKLEKRLNFNAFTIHVMVDRAGRKSTFLFYSRTVISFIN